MNEEMRENFIYAAQEILLLEYIRIRENSFLRPFHPENFFADTPAEVGLTSEEETASGDEPDSGPTAVEIQCLPEPWISPEDLEAEIRRIVEVNAIDIEYKGDTEKEIVSQEIDRLLYRPKTLVMFCDASYDHKSKQYSGAAAIYLSSNDENKDPVKITGRIISCGVADNNNHAEILTAIDAMMIADNEVRKWFQNEKNSIKTHERPDKIIMYCDNMIPINIFRWIKHNHNYTTSRTKTSSEPDDYEDSLIECHKLASSIYQFYFQKECKHMCKTVEYLYSDQNESYMYELIKPHLDQLRTDTHFISELDCFDELPGGFDIRHCPGHRGILVFDEVDNYARADLRVAVSRSHHFVTSYENIPIIIKATIKGQKNSKNPLKEKNC